MKRQFLLLIITLIFILTICGSVAAADNTTELVSVNNSSIQGNQASDDPVVSADGRFVAFSSDADNLVPGDTNGYRDVFVRDRFLNITERVSISTSGQEGNYYSYEPAVSADGRYIVFTSFASNLVAGGVPSGQSQLYVRDRLLGITELLSISPNGSPGDGFSQSGSISADGRYVAFISSSTNLMTTVTDGREEVYVRDMISSITERISVSNDSNTSGGCGFPPSISGDGRFVAFVSWAPLDGVDDSWADLFLYDRQLKTTTKIARQFNWDEGIHIFQTSLSDDGHYLAFVNRPFIIYGPPSIGDPNYWQYYNQNIFLFNRFTGNIKMVTVPYTGALCNYESLEPSISSDGRYLVFTSYATNLVAGDDNNAPDIFIFDQQSGEIQRVVESPVDYVGNSYFNPSLSAMGNYLVFNSDVDNLAPGDTNGNTDVFIHIFKEKISIQGYLDHERIRSGDVLRLTAASNMDTTQVTAIINGVNYNLTKQPDNWWLLNYAVPHLSDGAYPITLTAFDDAGNSGTNSINYIVDNTPPTVSGNVNPNILRSGDSLTLQVSSDPDTSSITTLIQGISYNLVKDVDGTWKLSYVVPNTVDGNYPIILTATDTAGNQGTADLSFNVDNTPPTVTGTITPNLVKSGDSTILTVSSSVDTARVVANISGMIFSLIKQVDGSWRLNYNVHSLPDGLQSVIITAYDNAGNQGTATLTFTVDNTPPTLTGTLTPEQVMAGRELKITVDASPDTASITATINNQKISLSNLNGQWTGSYIIPLNTVPGWDMVTIDAMDRAGNQGQAYAYYMVTASGSSTTPGSPGGIGTPTSGNTVGYQSGSNLWSVASGLFSRPVNYLSTGAGSDVSTVLVDLLKNFGFGSFVQTQNQVTVPSSGSTTGSIFGPLAPYIYGSDPFSGLIKDADASWRINHQGPSVYGPLAGILESPFNPFNMHFYIWDKMIQAGQKAWQSGNIWDFFNYDFYHIYGYSNLDNMWGGENLKQVIKFFTGVDENGDLSVGGFLLLLVSIVPIGRVGTFVGKFLSESPILMKIWNIIGDPLTNILKKFGISAVNPVEAFIGITSKIGSFLEPGLGLIPAMFEIVAGASGKRLLTRIVESPIYQQLMRYDTIRSIVTVLNPNNWNWTNFTNAWKNTINSSINIVKWTGSTLSNVGKQVVNNIARTVKTVVNNTVITVKKAVNNTVKTVKKVVNNVVNTVKKVVTKAVTTVKKAVHNVVNTVKKVVTKAVTTVKKAVNTVVNTARKTVNTVTNIGKSVGRFFRLW
ncbi:MAG: PD40 domain-containing protein [Methanobacterium sp.]|uniref:Ig-like domain-containing protein n=1 Tax=Methanobacterium sp. TaxID=2164 RepID=UPI003D6488F7|nr:PD40 domain-containing protein [Methanobacterium sp.]